MHRSAVSSVRAGTWRVPAMLLAALILCSQASLVAANDWIYSARPGDNIWSLTEKHLKSMGYWKALQKYNNVTAPRRIPPGTRLKIPIRWLKVQPASARVIVVRGDVQRVPAGAGTLQPAVVGDTLESGDGLRAGAESSATVEFADGSNLLVYAETSITMDSMSAYGVTGMVDTSVRLDRGRVENDVRPAAGEASRHQIITPTAVVAVRGTRFRTAFEEASGVALGEVTEGEVRFDAEGRRQRLPAGFGIRAEPGRPPEPPVELLPAPDLSGVAPQALRILVSLRWPDVPGAVAYRIQILAPGETDELLLDQILTSPGVDFDAPQDGEYRLRVRAIDERDLEGLDAEQALTVDARPIPPRLLGPADQAAELATQPPELWWSQPQDISSFVVQLARDEAFTDLVFETPSEATKHQIAEELEPGMHYWRVASVVGGGERGPFSDVRAFRAQAVPDEATASSAVEEDRVVIGWDPLAVATHYEFQLAHDEEFTDLVVDESFTTLEYVLEAPEAGIYYFRARGVSDEGVAGPYSPINSFEIVGEPLSPAWLLLLAPLLLLL